MAKVEKFYQGEGIFLCQRAHNSVKGNAVKVAE